MSILAWHFCASRDGQPVLRDGRPLKVNRWYKHTGAVVLCRSGYHASVKALDALRYAPGAWACLVECDGEIVHEADKLVASRRRALWTFDATDCLRLFARQCALDVAHIWKAPAVVRQYLETGDEAIRGAAQDAAADAAWDANRNADIRAAASTAAWAAARDAAWNAARDAADIRAAARAVARAAARAVARAAASTAAWAAAARATDGNIIHRHNRNLESLLYAAAHDIGLVTP